MRRMIVALLLGVPSLAYGAGSGPEGRWEGEVQIPGKALQLVVDLAQGGAGAWAGSIIIPGLGIKGAPLSNIVVAQTDLAFDLGNSLRTTYGPAGFKAHLIGNGVMAGELSQGGNVAKFSLRKVGRAQVESSQRSTPVRRDIEGEWSGDYELGGYPRHLTLTLENHADAATAKLVIVGKRSTDLPIDLVVEEGNFVRIESQPNRVTFEGRVAKEQSEIRGTIELGPFELPLVLRRPPQGT